MNTLRNCCRICLSAQNDVTTVYASKKQRFLPNVIYNISGVKLLHKKEPNAKICNRCADAVLAAEYIILECQESEEYLSQQRLQQQQKDKTKIQFESELELTNSQSTQENEAIFAAEAELLKSQSTLDNEVTYAAKTKLLKRQGTQENIAAFSAEAKLINSQSMPENGAIFTLESELTNSQSTQENDATFVFDTEAKPTEKASKTNKIVDFEYALAEDELSQLEIYETPNNDSFIESKKSRNASVVRKKHECQHCSYRTNSRIYLVEHYRNVHNLDASSMYRCSMCTEAFSWRRSLFLHMEKVHKTLPEGKRFICTECDKAYFSKYFLDDHIQQRHRGIVFSFKCPQPGCVKSFNRKFTLQRHFISMHTDVKRYFCRECDLHFSCLDKWRYHVQSVHQRKHCSTCGLWFRKQKVLDAHIASKKCEKCIYQCPNCPRRFTAKRGVKIHLEHSCKYNRAEGNEDIIEQMEQ